MKRQFINVRKANEDNETSCTNDTKKLKVVHKHENTYSDVDFQTAPSNGQETISVFSPINYHCQESFSNSASNDIIPNNSKSNNGEETIPILSPENGSQEEQYLHPLILKKNNLNNSCGDETIPILSRESTRQGIENQVTENQQNNMNMLQNISIPEEVVASSMTNIEHSPEYDILSTSEQANNNTVADLSEFQQLSENKDCPVVEENGRDGSSDFGDEEKMKSTDNDYSSSTDVEEGSSEVSPASPSRKLQVDIASISQCHLKVTALEGHADVVFSVAADKDFLLSSSGDTTIKVWNVEDAAEICNFAGHIAAVTAVILLSPEHSASLATKINCSQVTRIALSASHDCHIRLWSVLDGQEILSMYTLNSITCMGFLQEFSFVIIGTEGGKLEVWDLSAAKVVNSVIAHEESVSSVTVQDCYIHSVSKDGAVKVWLFEDDELQNIYVRRRKGVISTGDPRPSQWKTVAAHKNVLFLGDNTSCFKTINFELGHLHIHKNQEHKNGICEAMLVRNNTLFTTFYDPSSDTGGINVFRLPDLVYIGTLTGDLQEICSLAVTELDDDKLRIVSGGHQLLVWDFDFSKVAVKTPEDRYHVSELAQMGSEVQEKSAHLLGSPRQEPTESGEKKKKWCNIS